MAEASHARRPLPGCARFASEHSLMRGIMPLAGHATKWFLAAALPGPAAG